MIHQEKWHFRCRDAAFSLIEMVAAIAIISLLAMAGVGMFASSRRHALQSGTDQIISMIEQARVTAITSRCQVILAMVEPGNPQLNTTQYQLGLFKVKSWPENGTVTANLINRWKSLETGIVLANGLVNGLENPLDFEPIEITDNTRKATNLKVRAIVFNSRGALQYPPGSAPLALCIAEGSHRNGKPKLDQRENSKTTHGNALKICRLSARCYRIN